MYIKTEKRLAKFATLVFMWINGYLVLKILNKRFSAHNGPIGDFIIEDIIQYLFWGIILTNFTVHLWTHLLIQKYFKLQNYEVDLKIPYLRMWSALILGSVLCGILIIKLANP